MSETRPIRLICDAVSPRLLVEEAEEMAVRFRCQKATHHRGDHAIRLEWSRDEVLFDEPPWQAE